MADLYFYTRSESASTAFGPTLLNPDLGASQAEDQAIARLGVAFLAEVRSIEETARRDLVARYPAASRPSALGPSLPVIALPSGQTGIRQLLVSSGELARVERQLTEATTRFVNALKSELSPAVFESLNSWVSQEIASKVAHDVLPAGPPPLNILEKLRKP